jgi:hypothetical protein
MGVWRRLERAGEQRVFCVLYIHILQMIPAFYIRHDVTNTHDRHHYHANMTMGTDESVDGNVMALDLAFALVFGFILPAT